MPSRSASCWLASARCGWRAALSLQILARRRPAAARPHAPQADPHAPQADPHAPQADPHAPRPARIEIDAPYRDGLLHLGQFSHVLVLWWASRHDSTADRAMLRVYPRPAPERLMGVFSTRSPARPNPIAVSTCRLVEVDEAAGVVRVAAIDADDGTPVVDLKPYIPSSDRVRAPRVPSWLPSEPEWAAE
jgi:tRNA-Thr(GGU) m(6)t(6)A37 methyltransferase TsaA